MPVTPSLAIHFTLSETGVSESVLLVHFNSHLFCILIVKKLKDFIPQKYAKNNVSNNKKKRLVGQNTVVIHQNENRNEKSMWILRNNKHAQYNHHQI